MVVLNESDDFMYQLQYLIGLFMVKKAHKIPDLGVMVSATALQFTAMNYCLVTNTNILPQARREGLLTAAILEFLRLG